MRTVIAALLAFVSSACLTRMSLQKEILALRNQLAVYQRTCSGPG